MILYPPMKNKQEKHIIHSFIRHLCRIYYYRILSDKMTMWGNCYWTGRKPSSINNKQVKEKLFTGKLGGKIITHKPKYLYSPISV